MLGGTKQFEIPRRVVVYYLLFCLIPLVWMTFGIVLVSTSVLRTRHEQDTLVLLRAAASATTLELVKRENSKLQALAERLQRENSLQFVAIANRDGEFKAHTLRDRIGKTFERSDQFDLKWGEFTASRRRNGNVWMREYVAPLSIRKESLGTLLIGATEPTIWHTCSMAASEIPLTVFGPLCLVVAGAVFLHRVVRPSAEIESQLRQSAVAPALSDVDFHPIKAHTPAALGWNRLIAEFQNGNKGSDLDRRLAEAVQSRRAERADDILNSLSDGIAVTDPQGSITAANHALAALLDSQQPPELLRGKSIAEAFGFRDDEDGTPSRFFDPELRSRVVTDELIRGGAHHRRSLRVVRSPIRSTDRAMKQGHVWVLRDITQQKLADEMRNQFLSTATHELRTPLANIRAYAETLSLDDVIDVENQKEFLNVIINESSRLARFIDDLLSIDSMEAGALALERRQCDLPRLFEDVIGKVRGQLEQKNIEFSAVFPEKWPDVRLDKDKFVVALVNLLGNAAKYTPIGGRVTLKVKVTDHDLQIHVVDTGIGISAEELPRIFDKFFRSQSPAVQNIKGTGIGLSMAQEVIQLHDGELTVQSELGKGTTFIATVPLKV